MTQLNMRNRTLGIMDNLPFLRSLNNECIDLIAIDPPFAANETFTGRPRPPITDAEIDEEKALAAEHGAKHDEGRDTTVQDIWTWDANVHPDWLNQIEDDYPPVFTVIRAVEASASENEAAYIAFMAVRLIECRRVLKPTGSIYVHCDDHANSYLRMLMDAIFGAGNFRNEITWRRATSHNISGRYGRITDSLLYYVKSDNACWNGEAVHTAKSDEDLTKAYPSVGKRGRYRSADLTGAGVRSGESGIPWRGYDVTGRARHWAVPRIGNYAEYIEQNFIPGYRKIESGHARLDALDSAELIHHPQRGNWPGLKRYAAADQGNPPQNLILSPTGFTNFSASGQEFTGYATQKPLALYERIIEASSNPGDVVLDIFAGCATTAVAAERLDRQWIACDMAYRSWTMLKRRFRLNSISLSDRAGMRATDVALKKILGLAAESDVEWGKRAEVLGPDELPSRDDEDPDPFHNLKRVTPTKRGQQKSARSASWSGRIPKEEAKQLLVEKFGPYCWGCGWEAPQFPNGERDLGLLEVDHIWARKDQGTVSGGSDELYNLALLHATCNRRKSNRLTLEELRHRNADDQRIYGSLVHLGEATQFANEYILQRSPQPSTP